MYLIINFILWSSTRISADNPLPSLHKVQNLMSFIKVPTNDWHLSRMMISRHRLLLYLFCPGCWLLAVWPRIRDVYLSPAQCASRAVMTSLWSAPSVPQSVFTITEKAPTTRAFSWLTALTSAFTFKTLCYNPPVPYDLCVGVLISHLLTVGSTLV